VCVEVEIQVALRKGEGSVAKVLVVLVIHKWCVMQASVARDCQHFTTSLVCYSTFEGFVSSPGW